MKSWILLTIMSVSLNALAQTKVEFDENVEKACHEEAKKAGCVKADDVTDRVCAKKAKLAAKCREVLDLK